MALKKIITEKAPGAIGPYSQAIVANGFVFTAGQIPLDPAAGKIVDGGIVEQTDRVMENLDEVLRAAGVTWADVVKTTVYLHDLAHFPTVNEVYGKWLGDSRPARSTVQVASLPRGALVEIDVIAAIPK
ncbi:MAG TPA: RidA family protein [Gemmatimonadaceae bacterium]|jgi:2-iminobutanoate/2-iminopropanoate deaminase|nr:RidA family protein [Gemmatimonadaceae bacterium]